MALVGSLQSPSQQGKARGKLPMLQGSGIVEPAWLPFQECQVMHGVVEELLLLPAPLVSGDELVRVDQSYFVHRGNQGDLTVGVLDGHGVRIAVEAYQG